MLGKAVHTKDTKKLTSHGFSSLWREGEIEQSESTRLYTAEFFKVSNTSSQVTGRRDFVT